MIVILHYIFRNHKFRICMIKSGCSTSGSPSKCGPQSHGIWPKGLPMGQKSFWWESTRNNTTNLRCCQIPKLYFPRSGRCHAPSLHLVGLGLGHTPLPCGAGPHLLLSMWLSPCGWAMPSSSEQLDWGWTTPPTPLGPGHAPTLHTAGSGLSHTPPPTPMCLGQTLFPTQPEGALMFLSQVLNWKHWMDLGHR